MEVNAAIQKAAEMVGYSHLRSPATVSQPQARHTVGTETAIIVQHVHTRAYRHYYAYKQNDLIGTHDFVRRETNYMHAFPQTLPSLCSGRGWAARLD